MARHVEGPWFRTAKNTWYATLGGRNVSLGVRGEGGRKEAVAAWHRLMADGPSPKPDPAPDQQSEVLTVRRLADTFLADARARLKPATVGIYESHLDMLCGAFGGKPAGSLTAPALSRWLAGLGVGPTTQAIRLRSVSAFLGWAARHDHIPDNPAKKLPKPKARSRGAEAVVTDDDHRKLMAVATGQFRLVLRVLHATGCRPGEACKITAENLDAGAGVAKLADHKSDRTGKPRLVFLPPDLCETLTALAARYGSGPLLRSKAGKPWTARGILEAMRRVRRRAGVKAIAYGYRHGFATAALVKGVPDAQVAALLGHSSTAMLFKHYSHLTSQAAVLRAAAAQVRG